MDKDGKLIVMLIAAAFVSYVVTNIYVSSQEREKHKFETVCYINNIESGRGFTHIEGYFYYKGKRYNCFENVDEYSDKYLEKYYKIVLSSKDPYNYEIFYNEEVTDLEKIRKAGL